METYRSGHNEPDSKSGSPQGLVGSNPTVSAIWIGEGILDTFFWKVQNALADFMSGNNHFLLGLESNN